jgi:hypothetical protein
MNFEQKSRRSFRPRVETLESRMQPGSILTGGMGGAALADSLDLASLLNQTSQSTSLVHRKLNDSGTGVSQSDSSQVSIAPTHSGSGTVSTQPTLATQTSQSTVAINAQAISLNAGSHNAVLTSHQVAGSTTGAVATPVAGMNLQPVNFNVIPLQGGINPFSTTNWAHYTGTTNGGGLNGIASQSTGNTVSVGSVLEADLATTDALVVQYDPSGNIVNGFALTTGAGTTTVLNSVALAADDTVYAVGTSNVFGGTNMVFGSVSADLNTLNWAVGFNSANANAANGCSTSPVNADELDVTGYFTGQSSGNPSDMASVQLTGLGTTSPSSTAYYYNFGNTTAGYGIVADSAGNLDYGISYKYGATNVAPAVLNGPFGGTISGWYFFSDDINGVMRGVAVSGSGTVVFSGQLKQSSPNENGLLGTGDSLLSSVTGYGYSYNDGSDLTFNACGTDFFNSIYAAGSVGAFGGTTQIDVGKFAPDASSSSDTYHSTATADDGSDSGNGLTVDLFGNVTAVGTGTSTNFEGGVNRGGGATDGILLNVTLT